MKWLAIAVVVAVVATDVVAVAAEVVEVVLQALTQLQWVEVAAGNRLRPSHHPINDFRRCYGKIGA